MKQENSKISSSTTTTTTTTTTRPTPKKEELEPLKCSECGGQEFIDDSARGDTICRACGVVLPDRIICYEAEWRNFSTDDGGNSKSRTANTNPLLELPGTTVEEAGSARQKNAQEEKDKKLRAFIGRLAHIGGGANELPFAVTARAAEIYKEYLDLNMKGQRNEVLEATCLFAACRKEQVSRTMKEICELTNVHKEDLSKCFKILNRNLRSLKALPSAKIGDHIPRLCNSLDISDQKTISICQKVVKKLNEAQQGRNPYSISAASIYLVFKHLRITKTLAEICEHAGITEMTVMAVVRNADLNIQEIIDSA